MAAVTEDSNVVLKAPVAPTASFDAIKQKGVFGWDETFQTLTFCPVDGGDYKRLGLHPDSAPLAASLNSTDKILISVGGVLKHTTVQAIGGGGTWQPLDQDLTDIAALSTQAFGRSLLTQANAEAVRTLIGAPPAADLAGYQPRDSNLTAIADLSTQAFGRSLLTQVDAAAVRTLIGAGTSSFSGAYSALTSIPAAIDALDNLTPAADRLPYFTNGTTAALATFSAFARTLLDDADAATARATLGAGTVSSVAMSVPSGFSVSGSPITGSGTLAVTLTSQTAGKVLASPSGASGVPAFIALSASHIPNLPWSKITSGLPTTLAGYGITDAQPYGADLTAIEALSTTGYLQRTGTNTWTLAALTGWATKAFTNGSTTDVAEGTNLYYTDTRARAAISGTTPINVVSGVVSHSSADGHGHVPATGTTSNGKFLKAGSTANSGSWQVLVVEDLPDHGPTHEATGADPIAGQDLLGLRTTDSPVWRSLTLVRSLGSTIDGATKIRLLNNDSTWGGALWLDSVANMRMAFYQNDATWTDRYTFGRNGSLNLHAGALQIGAVDTITSTREGRFTGMRLSNMSSGQIPVASDADGQIAASGLTDDGTFLGASRVLRMWNSLARSGNTWTDLQWSQDVNERVSVLSSNSSGQHAYHSWVFVPADSEATGRVLGGQMWAQKVSGKSGTAPGLKAAMYAKTAGTGGSTGGFGAQIVCNYRPDNGATQVDALKIGAFGGGVADAVEAAILLRAKASFLSNFATIQDDAHLAPGLDILGTSNQGHIRILNNASASLLGGGIGDVEISGSKRVLIGNPGGGALLIGTNFTGINYPRFKGNTNWESSNRTGSALTADSETIVVYTGESNATESLPVASGSKRIIVFAHASNSGNWTLDADGTDMIAGELQANVGSITILPNSAVKQRRLIDHAFGLWVVI